MSRLMTLHGVQGEDISVDADEITTVSLMPEGAIVALGNNSSERTIIKVRETPDQVKELMKPRPQH
jgi:hypothetical protein